MQVLYNLFEWPTRPGARLAIIGIANTLDLPERLLPRIACDPIPTQIVYHPKRFPLSWLVLLTVLMSFCLLPRINMHMCMCRCFVL